MSESKISIARKALSLLGVDDSITNIDNPKTPTEIILSNWYDTARRDLLAMSTWNFAKCRFSCPKITEQPVFGEYESQFELPADYINTVWFGENKEDYDIYYKERHSLEGNRVLVNFDGDTLPLVYIKDEERTGLFTPWFNMALIYYLALLMSNDFNKNNTDIQALDAQFRQKLSNAKTRDASQSPLRIVRNEEYKTGYYDRRATCYRFEG